ncbi:MAG TPA: TetR/AcrR family transcriptional regulator [Candidatus Hydrogenedentes bacterium]|nr:TetR/AcrR family transcriptional regulator [Candidatus Hydrogenedentota bacterium]
MNARERSRRETRRRLIEQGTLLFSEQGVAETRAIDIARAAGVAVGTLYLHFKDKYDLLRAILFEGIEELLASLRALTENPPPSLPVFVRRHCEIMVFFVEEHPMLCRVLFDPESVRTNVSTEITEYLVEMQKKRHRAEIKKKELASMPDPLVSAHAVVGMMLHILDWWTRHPDQITRERLINTLTSLRLSGWYQNKPCIEKDVSS